MDIADDGQAEHREGAGGCRALELVGQAERDGALGPPERTCSLELGKGCIHLLGKLLEDAMRGWGLGATQDARYGTRFLEAPNPLVLVVVVVPSWRWWQRREASIALRAILTRLVPPWTITRLVLPAVFMRLVAPTLTGQRLSQRPLSQPPPRP